MAKKRMNGEGSWTQRDNGKWKLSILYKGFGRKYFYGTKQECLNKKQEFEALLSTGIVGEKDVLFKDFARSWLKNIKQPSIKPTSYDRLADITENFLIKQLGDLALQQIDDSLIQTMIINKFKTDGYSRSTIRKAYGTLGQIFDYAIARGKVNKNPIDNVVMPKRELFEEKEQRFFSEEERARLVNACYMKYSNGERRFKYGAFYVFLMYTGLRLGEGLALKWKYIDFEKRTVYVSRTIVYVKDRTKNDGSKILIDQSTTKGGRGRIVFLSDMAIEALNDLKKEKGYDPEQYIVRSRYNTIVRPADAYKVFQSILKQADIEQCGPHSLRHTFVSTLIDQGVPITMISKIVGHAKIDVTMTVYSHLLQETQNASMSVIKNLK